MKRILLVSLVLISFTTIGQTNFKWEQSDSIVKKTKSQIYTDTKLFIAQKWKSAKDVIQNDDKDGGIILIKGVSIHKVSFMMGEYIYIYSYSVTFKMRDNQYKIIIDNVYCESAHFSNGDAVTRIDPFEGDNCPKTGTFSSPGLPKKKAKTMMPILKQELQSIFDSYLTNIKKPSSTTDGW